MAELTAAAVLEDLMGPVLDAIAAQVDALGGDFEAFSGVASAAWEEAGAGADGLAGSLAAVSAAADGASGSLAAAAGAAGDDAAAMDADSTATDANTAAKTANAGATDASAASHEKLSGAISGLQLPLLLAGGALLAVGAGAEVVGSQYESAMSVVQALTGQSADTMRSLNDQVLAMGPAMGASPKELANGLYYVLSAGVPTQEAMGVLKTVTEASKAGFVDAATDAHALASALNAYGLGADKANLYQGILLTAVKDGMTTMQDLSGSIGRAAVTGNTAGFSFNQVAAAMSTMTLSGDTSKMAAIQLSFLMRALGINVDTVAKNATGMGLAFDKNAFQSADLIGKLNYLQQLTGGNKEEMLKLTGGANGLLAAQMLLTDESDHYNKILGDMAGAGSMVANAWEVHEHTMGAAWEHLTATVEVVLIRIKAALDPIVYAILDALTPALQAFGAWAQTHGPLLAALFGGLAIVIGTLLVGSVVALLVLMTPLQAIVLGIAAGVGVGAAALIGLGVALHSAASAGGPLQGLFSLLGVGLRYVTMIAAEAAAAFSSGLAPQLAAIASAVMAHVQPALAALVPVLMNAAAAFNGFLFGVLQRVGPAMQTIAAVISAVLTVIVAVWDTIWPGMSRTLAGVWNVIRGVVQVAWSLVSGIILIGLDLLGGHWGAAWRDMQNMLAGVWGGIRSILSGLLGILLGGLQTALALVQAVWGRVWGWVSSFFSGVWNGIVGFFGGASSRVTGTASGLVSGVQGIISGGFNAVKGIIQGAIQFVVNLFSWLYNHNYYFKDLVDTVVANFNRVRDFAVSVWGAISSFLVGLWNGVKVVALVTWTAITAGISAALNSARSVVQSIASAIAGVLAATWAVVSGAASAAWRGFVGIIAGVVGAVAGAVGTVVNAIKSPVQDLGGVLFSAGANLIHMLANGIQSAIGAVIGAAGNVAHAITGFLGFHSPTEEGPGADADEWAPNLIAMYARGLSGGSGVIKTAAGQLASALAQGLAQGPSGASAGAAAAGVYTRPGPGGASAQGANWVVTVNLNGPAAAGAALLAPALRTQLAQELGDELSKRAALQQRRSSGYSGLTT